MIASMVTMTHPQCHSLLARSRENSTFRVSNALGQHVTLSWSRRGGVVGSGDHIGNHVSPGLSV